MNLPVPMPSKHDVDSMKKLMNIIDNTPKYESVNASISGGYNGRQLNESMSSYSNIGAGQEDINFMKKILNQMSSVEENTSSQPICENISHNKITIKSRLDESNNKIKYFDVYDENNNIGTYIMKESAEAIKKILDNGYSRDSNRIREINEIDENFERFKKDTQLNASRYKRSIELGEKAAAKVFEERYQISKAHAISCQDQVKNILSSIR